MFILENQADWWLFKRFHLQCGSSRSHSSFIIRQSQWRTQFGAKEKITGIVTSFRSNILGWFFLCTAVFGNMSWDVTKQTRGLQQNKQYLSKGVLFQPSTASFPQRSSCKCCTWNVGLACVRVWLRSMLYSMYSNCSTSQLVQSCWWFLCFAEVPKDPQRPPSRKNSP